MKITKRQLLQIIREEAGSEAFSVVVDRAVRDQTVKQHYTEMMSRIMELIDVNYALQPDVHNEVADPDSDFARGIYDAIVEDLTEMLQGDVYR